MLKTEDFWATVIGLLALFGVWMAWQTGSPLAQMVGLNTAGLHWQSFATLFTFFTHKWDAVLLQPIAFSLILAIPVIFLSLDLERFLIGFVALFLLALVTFAIAGWAGAARFELEPPVVALLLGLAIGNTVTIPDWMKPALRVELYLKTGIVLLGATFPISLLLSAGSTALMQAAIGTIITVGVIYGLGRWQGLSHGQAAVLGTGAGVCGVSAAMAAGSAVGARRQEIYQAISLVILFALAWVIVLPQLAMLLGLTPGQGGAWIGTSELADAAGMAAASSFGAMVGHAGAVIKAFTLTKVIGRDVWIGLWAIFWTFTATQHRAPGAQPLSSEQAAAHVWWRRVPKFVIGFLLAAGVMSFLTLQLTPVLRHHLLVPLVGLRTWAFTLCFLAIGLNTHFRQLLAVERRVVLVFSVGVMVNLVVGYVLSVMVFGGQWTALH
ncbi:putative sulfate exporter family transporter [Acidiferrobacter sp.]|uniref:YeiH family protein n=1 Tax=Acidiferrobacter sp. TaxID=1872107 RepID=UPI002602F034|nr:putative sulfate exporter family transporter [Acidiferrobacter sp.]